MALVLAHLVTPEVTSLNANILFEIETIPLKIFLFVKYEKLT